MISNILSQMISVLRGKNGTIYFVCMLILLGMFLLKILPKILWLVGMSFIVFLIFRMFEKKVVS